MVHPTPNERADGRRTTTTVRTTTDLPADSRSFNSSRLEVLNVIESLTPRLAAAVGLVALVPALAYGLGRPGLGGFVSAVNVVIIFASLYVAFSPLETEHGAGEDHATA